MTVSLDAVRTRSGLGPVSLQLRKGEIVGVGGIKGSGGEGLLAALAGAERVSEGTMVLKGAPYAPREPSDAWAGGIATLPGDRTGEGVITEASVLENLTLATRPRRARVFRDGAAMRRSANEQVASLGIKAAGLDVAVGSLSGGNMQKVVLGKCLAAVPEVLLLNNPTRGVDIGAKSEIYRVIRRLADRGAVVLMVTEDLPELLGLSDRIVVTRGGRITREFDRAERPTEEEVVKWMM